MLNRHKNIGILCNKLSNHLVSSFSELNYWFNKIEVNSSNHIGKLYGNVYIINIYKKLTNPANALLPATILAEKNKKDGSNDMKPALSSDVDNVTYFQLINIFNRTAPIKVCHPWNIVG